MNVLKSPDFAVAAIEKEVMSFLKSQLVYHLYGMTEEQIGMVEGSVG
jgi:hypothetical protein